MTVEQLERLKATRLSQGLSQEALAAILKVGQTTLSCWERGTVSPKPEHQDRIDFWLRAVETKTHGVDTLKEAQDHCQQLKHLLNLLEFHLRYFQNDSPEARDAYRRELDVYDVGYLTSLMEMLFDEGKFQRWKVFTTHRFEGFRRKERGRKGKDKGESG